MNIIPAPSLYYKPRKSPIVILADMSEYLGNENKGKPMANDIQWLELYSESEDLWIIPMLNIWCLIWVRKGFLCCEGTLGMLQVANLFG